MWPHVEPHGRKFAPMARPTRLILWSFLVSVLAASTAAAETTLWLVKPLYPGQDALVDKTQKALDKLMPPTARKESVIGLSELGAMLKDKKSVEVPCFTGETRCADPIDAYVAALGFDRVVLVQGGQDEAGFKFRVVAYEPKAGKVTPATASNAVLEKALLGAVAKVVPVTSTLEVKSTPAGATVFVDDVKQVGVTPLSMQVLPGERVIKIDLKLHQPIEETVVVPMRGHVALEKTLEKVAARLIVSASPAGTLIFLDGVSIGKDKLDRGVAPGSHTIRLTAEGHKSFEQQVTVKADEQFVLDKTLEPINPPANLTPSPTATPNSTQPPALVKVTTPPPVVPPTPLTPTEETYAKKQYLMGSFEYGNLNDPSQAAIVGRRFGDGGLGRSQKFFNAGCDDTRLVNGLCSGRKSLTLIGGALEYGLFGSGKAGKYLGLLAFGVGYLTNIDSLSVSVGSEAGVPETFEGAVGPLTVDPVQVHLFTVRALHPMFRVAFWRFQLHVGGGLEFRTGVLVPKTGTPGAFYKDGFMPMDLGLVGRGGLRLYLVEGLFLQATAHFSYKLFSLDAFGGQTSSPRLWGANVGFGYGFD